MFLLECTNFEDILLHNCIFDNDEVTIIRNLFSSALLLYSKFYKDKLKYWSESNQAENYNMKQFLGNSFKF